MPIENIWMLGHKGKQRETSKITNHQVYSAQEAATENFFFIHSVPLS